MEAKKLFEGTIEIQRFEGKNAWTYIRLEGLNTNPENPFGWMRVKGKIDEISFERYHLMPFGNGELFFPLKAKLRKQLRKEKGDKVHFVCYVDDPLTNGDKDLNEFLQFDNEANLKWKNMNSTQQRHILHKLQTAKNQEEKASILGKCF